MKIEITIKAQIDNTCEAASQADNVMCKAYEYLDSEEGNTLNGWYMIVSGALGMMQTQYALMPEHLRNEEMDEIVKELYWHKYNEDKDGLREVRDMVNKFHGWIHDIWQELHTASDRFGFND